MHGKRFFQGKRGLMHGFLKIALLAQFKCAHFITVSPVINSTLSCLFGFMIEF